MTSTPAPQPAASVPPVPPVPSRPTHLDWLYFLLAAVGLVGTWSFNLTYEGANYVGDWFANPASSSAAVDILVVVAVAAVFYVLESRRLGWRLVVPLVFIGLSIAVAVAFALPLFLGLRERRLRARTGS